MFKKILILLFAVSLIFANIPSLKAESDAETCTYAEGMFICVKDGKNKKLVSAYCNYNDSDSEIEDCQERISENHEYKKYYRKQWKKYCENSPSNKRGEYCQNINQEFLFYRDEFLNIFLEDLNYN